MFDESQWTRDQEGTRISQRHVIGRPDCDVMLLWEATKLWRGQLPGRVEAIQEAPLRCEMMDFPPQRILEAAGIDRNDRRLCRYWNLRPDKRWVAIYHNCHTLIPLPALPKGIMLCGEGDEGGIGDLYSWDEPKLLSRRIYVNEAVPGTVLETWPDLAPRVELPDPAEGAWAYALQYDRNLEVTAIQFYRYEIGLMPADYRQTWCERRQSVAQMAVCEGVD